VFCEVLNLGETPPIPKKPYLIKQLLKDVGGGDDSGLQVRDTPISLRDEQLDLAVDIVTGRLENVLPVAYVSLDFGNYPTLDVDELARRLGGLAHVAVEPHRHFSVQVARRAGAVNPWGGAVGLFWPGSQERAQRAEARSAYLEETVRALQDRESERADVSFLAGSEQEFFPGELKDAIVRTLQEDAGNFSAGSRRDVLISDFVAANPPSDVYDRLEAGIKDCLSKTDRVGNEEIKQLEQLGFSVTDDGKHYKAVFENDARFTFALFKTASDHRSGKNIASDMIKKLTKR
jgi:hypothetical protein